MTEPMTLVQIVATGSVVAVLMLTAFVIGWNRGSESGRQQMAREQARRAALERIRNEGTPKQQWDAQQLAERVRIGLPMLHK